MEIFCGLDPSLNLAIRKQFEKYSVGTLILDSDEFIIYHQTMIIF